MRKSLLATTAMQRFKDTQAQVRRAAHAESAAYPPYHTNALLLCPYQHPF